MQVFLVLLLVVAMLATVFALVRGIIAFLRTSEAELKSGNGPSASSLKSNKAMQQRILFQGLAVLVVLILLALASS